MTRPRHNRSPRRSNAQYRWTRPRIHAFLRTLGETGSVAAAAREVGVSRQSAYNLRERLGADFAAVWDEGVRNGRHRRKLTQLVQVDGFWAS